MDFDNSSGAEGQFPHDRATLESFDWDTDEPAMSVVEAVASVTDSEPTNMRPLSESVDPDALNALFLSSPPSTRGNGHVQFAYERCLLRVTADGEIWVVPPEWRDSPDTE